MKSVVVTGAGGFIGSELVRLLLSEGTDVYAVVRRGGAGSGRLPASNSLHIIECDMDEYETLAGRIPSGEIDVFYHFSWEGSAGPLRADYALQLANVRYSVDAVKAAAAVGAKCFCGAGSIMEHEANVFIPQNESIPSPAYMYSTAKLTAHYMAKIQAAELGIPFVWGVISNAFGEGEISPRFVNTTLMKLLYGKELAFTEGKQYYDFLHVSDMARAFQCIGEKGKPFTAYYLGSGNPRPLREFIEIMGRLVNPKATLAFGQIPFNGVFLPERTFDATKLFEDTGFRPMVSFEEGIVRTLHWLKEREGLV